MILVDRMTSRERFLKVLNGEMSESNMILEGVQLGNSVCFVGKGKSTIDINALIDH